LQNYGILQGMMHHKIKHSTLGTDCVINYENHVIYIFFCFPFFVSARPQRFIQFMKLINTIPSKISTKFRFSVCTVFTDCRFFQWFFNMRLQWT